ncbi:MAG: hypothetical protein HYY84_10700 [Deltaproteobacteria bacterium]|nr:hypothetical protein [Deltaproteobacteria bacterium]
MAVIAVLLVLGVSGFVAFKFYAAGAIKMEIEKESAEALDRAFNGQSIKKVADALKIFASERGCEATGGPPQIVLEPSENPDQGTLTFDCKIPVKLLVVTIAKNVRIEKSRKRSAAYRTIQDVKARLQRAQDAHDQRLEQRMRGAE